jgi:CheY-like chemotaxis protein
MTRRVLVVDDDRMMAQTLSEIFQLKGWEVATAFDGLAAVKATAADDFDVVLMDIKMPGMDGVAAFRAMKAAKPHLKVVLMTAFAAQELIAEAEREGVIGDDGRLVMQHAVARLRLLVHQHERRPGLGGLPAKARAQLQRAAVGAAFQHAGKGQLQRLGDEGGSLREQRGNVVRYEGALAEIGDGRLLTRARLERGLRRFALGDVENERDAAIVAPLERGPADDDRDALTILADVLLLVRLHHPALRQLPELAHLHLVELRGRDLEPVELSRFDVLARVARHAKERVVGVLDAPLGVPEHDAEHVALHHAAETLVGFAELFFRSAPLPPLRRDGCHVKQLVHLYRLDQVVHAVLAHRRHRAFDGRVAGEHHDLGEIRERVQPLDQLHPVHVGKAQVDERDGQLGRELLGDAEAALRARLREGPEARQPEDVGQRVGELIVVVDDQDLCVTDGG